jgi:hypothetical protein
MQQLLSSYAEPSEPLYNHHAITDNLVNKIQENKSENKDEMKNIEKTLAKLQNELLVVMALSAYPNFVASQEYDKWMKSKN